MASALASAPGLPYTWYSTVVFQWVLLRWGLWHQAREVDGILSEIFADPVLRDWVCLHKKVTFALGVKVHTYHAGPIVADFSGGWGLVTPQLAYRLSHAFLLVYMYRSSYVYHPHECCIFNNSLKCHTKLIYSENSNLTKAKPPCPEMSLLLTAAISGFFSCFVSSEFSCKKSQIEEIINLWQLCRYN